MVWSEAETPFPSNLVSNEYWYQYIYWWFKLILLFITRKNCFRYLKLMSPLKKTIIWPWGQRSRSHEGHYGTRHTVLWSCTHIPNIIDLSGKTKMLWSGQASRRRSRRINQTKTMSTKYNWPIWKDIEVMVRTSFAEKKQKKRKNKSD